MGAPCSLRSVEILGSVLAPPLEGVLVWMPTFPRSDPSGTLGESAAHLLWHRLIIYEFV